MYYIYKTTNLINGKTYIGQHNTKDIMNDQYKGSGKLIKKAFSKYGAENFRNEIIEVVESKFQANVMEKIWIKREKSKGKAEYNLLDGGEGFTGKRGPMSEEHKKSISNAKKGVSNRNKGKHYKLIDGKRVYY